MPSKDFREYAFSAEQAFKRLRNKNGKRKRLTKAQKRAKRNNNDFKGTYREYLTSHQWNRRRKAVRKRARGKCELCGVATGPFDVHHKTYERLFREPLTDLVYACRACHSIEHGDKHLESDPLSREFRSMFK